MLDRLRRLRVAADGVEPAAPDEPRGQKQADERQRDHDEDRVRNPVDRAAADRLHDRRHARDERPVGCPEREAPDDAQRRQRDDERVGDAAVDEDQPVGGADCEPRAEDRGDRQHARARIAVDDRADDARERDRRADGEVDPARHDHEQLAEREHGDHRGLGEDVPDVPRGEEHRRRQADDDDQQEKDQRRPRTQSEQPALEQPVAVEPEDPAGRRALLRLRRRHRHSPPTATSTRDQTGPSGNACSSSDAGSISML